VFDQVDQVIFLPNALCKLLLYSDISI